MLEFPLPALQRLEEEYYEQRNAVILQRNIVEKYAKEWAAMRNYVTKRRELWRWQLYEIFNGYIEWPYVSTLSHNQMVTQPERQFEHDWTAVRECVAIHKEVLQRDLGNQLTEPWEPMWRILLKGGEER